MQHLMFLRFRQRHLLDAIQVVLPHVAHERRDHAVVLGIAPHFIDEVQCRHHPRTRRLDDARRGQRLARTQHHRVAQRYGVEIVVELAADLLRAGLHQGEIGRHDLRLIVEDRHQAVAVGTRGAQRQRPVRRDVDRDGIIDIAKAAPVHLPGDLGGPVAIGVVHVLALQHRAHDAQVFAKFLDGHRVLSHHAHRGMAGADAEKGSPGSDDIDRRNGRRRRRRDARAGDRDARADPDLRRALGGQRHRRVAVRPHHLRVRKPARVVTPVFQILRDAKVGNAGLDVTAELHGASSCVPVNGNDAAGAALRRAVVRLPLRRPSR